jgi:hypothetical protein
MSWRHTPAFHLIPQNNLSNFASGPSLIATPAGSPVATRHYRVVASYDGPGRMHNAASSLSTIGIPAGSSVIVSWAAIPRARWYKVYRSIIPTNVPESAWTLVYSGPLTQYLDSTPTSFVVSNETLLFIVAPYSNVSATGLTYETKPSTYEWCNVRDVSYEDQSEADQESVERSLLVKEFGVRPKVSLRFVVRPGSEHETRLVTIYGAKLAFPDVLIKFSLFNESNWGRNIRDVRIKGSYPHAIIENVNERYEVNWEIVAVDLLQTVPHMGHALDVAAGKGTW